MSDYQDMMIPICESDDKSTLKALQKELAELQQKAKDADMPLVILLDGWSTAGKGRGIGKLISQLDPRGYQVYPNTAPEPAELRRPYLWRFWKNLPARGQIAVFDRGWYQRAGELHESDAAQAAQWTASINTFERQLCDDGYLVLKYFLHIDHKTQRDRLHELAQSRATAWRVTENDWAQNRNYEQIRAQRADLLDETSTYWAPWRVVCTEDKTLGMCSLLRSIQDAIVTALERGAPKPVVRAQESPVPLLSMPWLDEVDLSPVASSADYDEALDKERKRLRKLHSQLYREKIPVIICFEGWDAAGKGGAIRRLSWALDPRGFDVVPVAAPSKEELSHHYLWRFWNQVPKDGHITIFDRTWYGRVMVERVEGFTPEARWEMGYDEINEFEQNLHEWGAVILKFWIHIDKDTQLARFTERQNTPEKLYKITDEDWRNREKWQDYEQAVDELLQKTSTVHAPWIIVEGNDKKYARLKVLKTVRRALERRLHP